MSELHVCIDKVLQEKEVLAAAEKAIVERPDNAPTALPPGVRPETLSPEELAFFTGKRWRIGSTLNVGFLGGNPTVQQKVEAYAHLWSRYANIQFDFNNRDDAPIRISFESDGSWSYMGTDAMSIDPGQPTMNFGWLAANTADDEYSRVVLHEFGHALGCIHEHQSPAAGIPWDTQAVYAYYMGPPNNWPKEQVDQQIFAHYSQDQTQFTKFDTASIMLYPIQNELTIGDYEVGGTELYRLPMRAISPRSTRRLTRDTIPCKRHSFK